MFKVPIEKERRRYIRLDSVFPVQFRLKSPDGENFLSEWLQGFTSNIGKGGICLYVNKLHPEQARLLKEKQARLALEIELPVFHWPISAIASVAWIKELFGAPNKYLIGLTYQTIDRASNNKIMRFAWTRKLFFPVALGVILLLVGLIGVNALLNNKLAEKNKRLVKQLVEVTQETTLVHANIEKINQERQALEGKINDLVSRIQDAEAEKIKMFEETKQQEAADIRKIEAQNVLIGRLSRDKDKLQKELSSLKAREGEASDELTRLDGLKAQLTKENVDRMLKWLAIHQNPRTGLVMSFEGDGDIANWGFIYDQALAAIAFSRFGETGRAQKILDFFEKKAKRQGRMFFNAYYVQDGTPAEFIVHSGPNIWLGVAIMHYTRYAQDARYLALAEEIAEEIIELAAQDSDGGIRGGPQMQWFATEHNLDAYAFFTMLYKITSKTRYLQAADRLLGWLIKHTYDSPELPIKRGKGDATIATDTYAWSIAAVGPEKLKALGLDPDKIMEFAQQHCGVETVFERADGIKVKVKGFDFAPQQHLARGGVVSAEWTSQMIIAFKIMSGYHFKYGNKEKTRKFALEANEYLSNLGAMVISSPSPSGQGESCLPYASQDSVNTGHGWMTPKGKSTGSVASTAYTIFAYYNFNPLELKEQ